jgi:hypothetical protein
MQFSNATIQWCVQASHLFFAIHPAVSYQPSKHCVASPCIRVVKFKFYAFDSAVSPLLCFVPVFWELSPFSLQSLVVLMAHSAICSILSILILSYFFYTTGIISLSSFNDSSWIAIILSATSLFSFRCGYLMAFLL